MKGARWTLVRAPLLILSLTLGVWAVSAAAHPPVYAASIADSSTRTGAVPTGADAPATVSPPVKAALPPVMVPSFDRALASSRVTTVPRFMSPVGRVARPMASSVTTVSGLAATQAQAATTTPSPSVRGRSKRTIPIVQARVVATLPHDRDAFTEGLFIREGQIYESTGNLGRSVIRVSDLASGRVLRQAALAPSLFGEGIVDWRDEIVSVTWKTELGFRWDRATLGYRGSFQYPGEGWGLTHDATSLILSDGTPTLRMLDPVTFTERRQITVTAGGVPVRNLNELEWVDGEILANVWQTPRIARIDPATGQVTGWIDLSAIVATMPKSDPDSVANGIAWDAKTRRLYVTGKNWPSLFQIAWPVR